MALFAVSCNKSEDKTNTETTDDAYVGTLTVDSEVIEDYTGGLVVGYDFDMDDVKANYKVANDLITIELFGVKFAEAMPVTLDIVIPNIPVKDGEFSIDSVVPTVAGVPMDKYTMTNVSGEIGNLQLYVEFDCLDLSCNYLGDANLVSKTFELEDVRFVPTVEGDVIEIEMYGVKFAEAMPVSLDIVVSDVAIANGKFGAESVVPTVSTVPMPAYTMTDFAGELSKSNLNVKFNCMGATATYEGKK